MAEKNAVEEINKKGLDAQEVAKSKQQDAIKENALNYKYPESDVLKNQLEWFMDQKFGLMVHWGLYNQVGLKESWPLVDRPWTKWQFKPGTPNIEVKQMYSRLHKGFFPIRFDPNEWADIAYGAGFRYLCFTTKHHDGFCMWDTKTTDYKVTGSEVPWREEKYADITKELFNAFRAKNMGISLYYSRADFSCPYYWEEGYGLKDGAERVPSYDPDEKPEKWKKFQEFVFAQLKELVTNYGKIDCLWYDGGCDGIKLGLPEMTEELRKIQPWMLGVLRGASGICEDIVTPELLVPDEALCVPWETCTVMGKKRTEFGDNTHTSFGYTFDQEYMSAKEVAHLLLDIVAKGGNLALNLAPQPDGRLPLSAVDNLKILSKWMSVFSSAIYATRAYAPYRHSKYAYTRSKDFKKINVFYMYDDGEKRNEKYSFPLDKTALCVTDLRSGEKLGFSQNEEMLTVTLPEKIIGNEGDIADCFVVDAK